MMYVHVQVICFLVLFTADRSSKDNITGEASVNVKKQKKKQTEKTTTGIFVYFSNIYFSSLKRLLNFGTGYFLLCTFPFLSGFSTEKSWLFCFWRGDCWSERLDDEFLEEGSVMADNSTLRIAYVCISNL